jgi:hypothetical protein
MSSPAAKPRQHLLALEDSRPPVLTPREFLQQLGDAPASG